MAIGYVPPANGSPAVPGTSRSRVCPMQTLRSDLVVDVGRSINPSVDVGQVSPPWEGLASGYVVAQCPSVPSPQVEGAFLQGVGLFTLEQLLFSPDGRLLTRGPSQYLIPATCDMPLCCNITLLPDSRNPHAIYSSKVRGCWSEVR